MKNFPVSEIYEIRNCHTSLVYPPGNVLALGTRINIRSAIALADPFALQDRRPYVGPRLQIYRGRPDVPFQDPKQIDFSPGTRS